MVKEMNSPLQPQPQPQQNPLQTNQPLPNKSGLLYFIAQGIKSKLPDAEVNVTADGVEVVFTKEMILKRLFEKAETLSQITEVEVNSRGIVVKVKV